MRTPGVNVPGGDAPHNPRMPATPAPFTPLRGIVVDAETTGTNEDICSLIELGAVDLATGDEFFEECQAFEGAFIDPAALKVNGATPERVFSQRFQPESSLIRNFTHWVLAHGGPRQMLKGQNPSFDRDFVSAARKRAGYDMRHENRLFSTRTVDMQTLAVGHAFAAGLPVPESGFNTDQVYELIGMQPEPKPHNGLTGARMEAVALSRLLGARAPQLAKQVAFVESLSAPVRAPSLRPLPTPGAVVQQPLFALSP